MAGSSTEKAKALGAIVDKHAYGDSGLRSTPGLSNPTSRDANARFEARWRELTAGSKVQ